MQVVLCQTDIAWEDAGENRRRVRELVAEAAVVPGALLVLPEMWATGFSMDVGEVAEPEGGASEAFLAGLAEETDSCLVAGVASGSPGLDSPGSPGAAPHNTCVAVAPGGKTLCRYRKMHPFSLAGEANFYRAGEAVTVFSWGGLTVCPSICYDLRFPELYRAGVGLGAELFTVIANWPAPRHEHWRTLARARAIENQAFVVAVNRSGEDPHHRYLGGSMVIAPNGDVLAEAGEEPGALGVVIDTADVAAWRAEFPALRDRHPALTVPVPH